MACWPVMTTILYLIAGTLHLLPRSRFRTYCPLKTVSVNLTVVSMKSELDQLAEGLHLLTVLELLKTYLGKCCSLFIHNSACKLTAEQMIMLFHPQLFTTSSSRHVIEDVLIQNWNEYSQNISHGNIRTWNVSVQRMCNIIVRTFCIFIRSLS